jgi:hypothetical protein
MRQSFLLQTPPCVQATFRVSLCVGETSSIQVLADSICSSSGCADLGGALWPWPLHCRLLEKEDARLRPGGHLVTPLACATSCGMS